MPAAAVSSSAEEKVGNRPLILPRNKPTPSRKTPEPATKSLCPKVSCRCRGPSPSLYGDQGRSSEAARRRSSARSGTKTSRPHAQGRDTPAAPSDTVTSLPHSHGKRKYMVSLLVR